MNIDDFVIIPGENNLTVEYDDEYDDNQVIKNDDESEVEKPEDSNFDFLDMKTSISQNSRGLQINSILSSLVTGYYVIPPFQRRYVWNKTKVAELAKSIVKNIPIPPLYLYVDRKTKKQVVLDGQQRIIAIFLYFTGLAYLKSDNAINFGEVYSLNTEVLKLEKQLDELVKAEADSKEIKVVKASIKNIYQKLEKEHSMKRCKYIVKIDNKDTDISFCNFKPNIQEYLLHQELGITIVECHDEKPQKTYAHIFKLLNTAGKRLGAQEVRNGIYWQTNLYRRLVFLNESNLTWRQIYGKISVFSKDVEILLKTLAVSHYSKIVLKEGKEAVDIDYIGFKWRDLIYSYSELSETELLDDEIDKLSSFLDKIDLKNINGSKCRKAVFEAAYVAYSLIDADKVDVIDYEWLCNIGDSFDSINSHKTSVEGRLTMALIAFKEKYNA